MFLFFLVFVVVPLCRGQSLAQIFGRLKELPGFLLWIAVPIGKSLLAYGVTILLIVAVFRVMKAINAKKEAKNEAIDYIARFLPVKTLFSVGSFFADSRNSLRQVLAGEKIWCGPLFALFLTVAALDGLQSLLSLPPMKASAADVIYQASMVQYVAHEDPLLMFAAPDQLSERATPAQLETSRQQLPEVMWMLLQREWTSEVSIRRELRREWLCSGTSSLGIYLEWVYGIRTSDDLLAALPGDFSGRARIKSTADELEHTTKWDQLIQDGFLAVLVVPLADVPSPCFARLAYRQFYGR
jgi:hypothetical protein